MVMKMKCIFEKCVDAIAFATANKGFGVFYGERQNSNQDVHVHDCCEIFYCHKGNGRFLINDKIYSMKTGDLFVINQFEAHKVLAKNPESFVRYALHVHPAFLHDASTDEISLSNHFYHVKKPAKVSLTEEEQSKMKELFGALSVDYVFGDDMYKRLRAIEILLETARLFFNCQEESTETLYGTVKLAIDYINKNYERKLTLEEIAKKAFVSVPQLNRVFNRFCGTTVTKYIISKRIIEAKKMLLAGSSVTDTAFCCGFNDYANFIRTFKAAVGVSPGKYKAVSGL